MYLGNFKPKETPSERHTFWLMRYKIGLKASEPFPFRNFSYRLAVVAGPKSNNFAGQKLPYLCVSNCTLLRKWNFFLVTFLIFPIYNAPHPRRSQLPNRIRCSSSICRCNWVSPRFVCRRLGFIARHKSSQKRIWAALKKQHKRAKKNEKVEQAEPKVTGTFFDSFKCRERKK